MKRVLLLSLSHDSFTEVSHLETRTEYLVNSVESVPAALERLERARVDVALVRLPTGDDSATSIVDELQAANPSIPVVVYQPGISLEDLCELIERATGEPARATADVREPWSRMLIGNSRPMSDVVEVIRLVGDRRSTVLITGETGTGKEVAARALHMASSRANQPFVAINCAALPEHLLEAELFGHTKGAFTGAFSARLGRFEQAHKGTILLDEIGDMPLALQAKLLRVIQERELQRLGGSETVRIDVRVIAASNIDLAAAVAEKRFRPDLYYRLNVVPLRMPALRERTSDIPALVEHFIEKISQQEGTPLKRITTEALDHLARYSWPGNVRQLEHAVESAMALSGARRVLYAADFKLPAEAIPSEMNLLANLEVPESGIDFEQLIANIERTLLEGALLKCGGNKARAAEMLKLKRTTLLSKFKALQDCA